MSTPQQNKQRKRFPLGEIIVGVAIRQQCLGSGSTPAFIEWVTKFASYRDATENRIREFSAKFVKMIVVVENLIYDTADANRLQPIGAAYVLMDVDGNLYNNRYLFTEEGGMYYGSKTQEAEEEHHFLIDLECMHGIDAPNHIKDGPIKFVSLSRLFSQLNNGIKKEAVGSQSIAHLQRQKTWLISEFNKALGTELVIHEHRSELGTCVNLLAFVNANIAKRADAKKKLLSHQVKSMIDFRKDLVTGLLPHQSEFRNVVLGDLGRSKTFSATTAGLAAVPRTAVLYPEFLHPQKIDASKKHYFAFVKNADGPEKKVELTDIGFMDACVFKNPKP